MKLSMPFGEYIKILRAYSNIPLSLNRLTLPFGVIAGSDESKSLLVGHVLDELASRFSRVDMVDCIDVVASAYELGHEQAGDFLDQAPLLMARMNKDQGAFGVH